MPGWGLVAVALLAKGSARSQAKRVPCAEREGLAVPRWKHWGTRDWAASLALCKNQPHLRARRGIRRCFPVWERTKQGTEKCGSESQAPCLTATVWC